MNRTLLLILCDFLLLTLLALTRWETAEPERPVEQTAGPVEADEGAVTAADDVVELMQLSFEDQQAEQAAMEADMAAQLEARAVELAERERALQELEAARNALQAERATLSADLAETQRTAAELRQRAESAAGEAAASRARVEQLQRDLEAKENEAAQTAAQAAQLAEEKAAAEAQVQQLNVAVAVAEQEKTLLRETAQTFREQAEKEREERIKVQETTTQLAQGVGALAERSEAITQEIRENRPINANILFSDFLLNRVPAQFNAARINVFGNELTRNAVARTILVRDGEAIYAIMHVEDTPFNFEEPASQWARVFVTLAKDGVRAAAPALHFINRDPRIVAIPVEASQATALGVKIYDMTIVPFRFPEAVLISKGGEGYGEVPFKLESDLPGYVRMDNRLIRRLAGDYSPSRGDLVLSKTGELLGVMVTSDLCAMVDEISAAGTIRTGDTSGQNLEGLLERMEALAESRDR
ncbi:hypothetical protein [Actomonas aquatica]|uniref:Chromosome partition protein Smc n=1 Tax=Actomonas aquatica TaxID=2866162 RepID=A0ABZ1C752_9BACT|nr:hypothetical protein [Opitutus sp. WL0086]WRQ87083.1 hypothetical protein K1X11_019890 [Opitutus sp. WL0086]